MAHVPHFERNAVKRIAMHLLATAVPLFATASAFAWGHHCCGRVVYAPMVTGAPASGFGTAVTPASAFAVTPASSFAVMPASSFAVAPAASFASFQMSAAPQFTTVAPASSFAGFQQAPPAGMQLSFALPVTFTAGQQGAGPAGAPNVQPAEGLPGMQSGFQGVKTPRFPTTATAGCVTEAQVRALLEARLATTDAKLRDIYDLLVLIARNQKVQVPSPRGFSMSTPSSDSQRNSEETRRLLTQIERKQVAWKEPATVPAGQADRNTAEVQRLLAQISAKQAAWSRSAEAAVSVTRK
jgi:hypothetical protein